MAEETSATGASLLTYAQFATDLVHRFAAPESSDPITANCAHSGRITMQLTDRDGSGRASAGDTVTAVLENCGVPALVRTATGVVRVDIQSSASQTVTTDFMARLTVVEPLHLTTPGGRNPGHQNYGVLRGSIGVQWSEDTKGNTLRAVSTTEDDLNFTGIYDGVESVDRMRRIDVSQSVRYELATGTSTIAFLYDVGSRGGVMRVRTPVTLQGDLDVVPRQMRVEIDMAGGQMMRLERATADTGPRIDLSLINAAGVTEMSGWIPWTGNLLRLADDIRNGQEPLGYTDQGYSVHAVTSWRETNVRSDIDRACLQGSSLPYFKADAVFQRPVAPPRPLSEADGVLYLQFDRTVAAVMPTFQFQFIDNSKTIDPRYPVWNIPAVATRHGAYYEISPTEPLVKGHSYFLGASIDGSDWDTDIELLDASGQVVFRSSAFATFDIESSLTVGIAFGDTASVSTSAPARLQARPSLAVEQWVANVQWEQLGGPPVTLSAPNDLETDVSLPGSHEVQEALLQVTVTDSRGATDRARVIVTVGNYVTQGAALYTEVFTSGAPRRALETGEGSIFYGPQPGVVRPRTQGPTAGGTGVAFSVTTVGGAQLQPGLYANAAFSDEPGSVPGLRSRVWCWTSGSPVSGSFEVLEVAYGLDGSITKLALDYEQRCEMGGEYERGSYRFNSSQPLKP